MAHGQRAIKVKRADGLVHGLQLLTQGRAIVALQLSHHIGCCHVGVLQVLADRSQQRQNRIGVEHRARRCRRHFASV